jgi:hypothetical protein
MRILVIAFKRSKTPRSPEGVATWTAQKRECLVTTSSEHCRCAGRDTDRLGPKTCHRVGESVRSTALHFTLNQHNMTRNLKQFVITVAGVGVGGSSIRTSLLPWVDGYTRGRSVGSIGNAQESARPYAMKQGDGRQGLRKGAHRAMLKGWESQPAVGWSARFLRP